MFERFAQFHHGNVEPVLFDDEQTDPDRIAGADHGVRIIERERHRLFNEDVLAMGSRSSDVLAMKLMRCGDVDGFDLRVGAHVFDCRISACLVFAAEALSRWTFSLRRTVSQ